MITSAFFYVIYGLVWLITLPIRNLADVAMSASFSNAVDTASGYIASFNEFIPIDTIAQILLLFLTIEGAVLTYKLIMWLIRRIPTQS